MFFFLSKVLKFCVDPLTWILVLFLLSFILRRDVWKNRLRIIAFSLLVFFTNGFILDEFMRAWEVPAVRIENNVQYEAGIVLGGMLTIDARLDRLQFFRGTDRILQAVNLYKTGKIKQIVFTGGSGYVMNPDEKEGVLVKRFLLELGIPESDVLIENESRNTYQNATFTKVMMDETKLSGNWLLITSAVHMKRATACFSKAGIETTAYSTDRYSGNRKFLLDHLFLPNVNVLQGWDVLIHEYIGYLSYKILGYC